MTVELQTIVLWGAVALNFAGAAVSAWQARHLNKLSAGLIALKAETEASPEFTCVTQGHDLELETMTLDKAEPPVFTFTHTFKWTCSRCPYEDFRTMRQHVFAPEVKSMEGGWLDVNGEVEDDDA